MTSRLFEPITLRGLTLPNRIVVSPMCQYSAREGSASNWHVVHLGHLALSGGGLLILEATGVEPRGRISPACLGMYSDENEAALKRVINIVREVSPMPIGIQLAHAGRKASTKRPVDGRGPLDPDDGGWRIVGPSAAAFAEGWQVPEPLDGAGMDGVIEAFVAATRRCDRIGLDLIEIHGAHGYLLSSFLSPLANRRTDDYGGSLHNRMRFPLQVFSAMRAQWPAHKPIGIRLNGTDWAAGGIEPGEAVTFAAELKKLGCDYVVLSSGGNTLVPVDVSRGFQVPFAAKVKAETGIATMTVGLIREPEHAESIIVEGKADMVALARGFLNDPRWPWHAAEDLGTTTFCPSQYRAGATRAGVPSVLTTGVAR